MAARAAQTAADEARRRKSTRGTSVPSGSPDSLRQTTNAPKSARKSRPSGIDRRGSRTPTLTIRVDHGQNGARSAA